MAYECQTTFVDGHLEGGRHRKCFEAELARKDELVKKALKIIKYLKALGSPAKSGFNSQYYILQDDVQAFLTRPEVVKAMESD